MASRAVGAILAVVSALALVGALVSGLVPGTVVPGWWDGHPEVDGKVIERKQLRVGLLDATGCNLGETLVCEDKKLELGDTTQLAGLGELAALGLAELVGIALLVTIARVGKRRRTIGKLALGTAVLVGAGAGALAYLGPDLAVKQQVEVPIGIGRFVAWGAAGTALLAGVIAIRLEPEPLRLKPSMANVAVDPALANTLDVRDMLRDQHGGVSPAALGPEPMIGGNISAPVTPLRGSPAPLVPHAPQLRPLYDIQGASPVPAPPVLPVAPPTPVPRASIRAIASCPR